MTKRKFGAGWFGERSSFFKAQVARHRAKEWAGFLSPEGVPHGPITNLSAFCRDHGLDPSAMRQVALGYAKMHHGWTRIGETGEVVPLPYLGIVGVVYLYQESSGECFGPFHSARDVTKCSHATGISEWVIRELLSKERDEYEGWKREEG